MTFKLSLFSHKWKRIFMAAVIFILLAHMYLHLRYGEHNIIIAFFRGILSTISLSTYWYYEASNSYKDYQGNDSVSSFSEMNRLHFQRLIPRSISKRMLSKKATNLSRADIMFEKRRYLNASYFPAHEKENEESSTTKVRFSTPRPVLKNKTRNYNLYDYATKMIEENVLNKIFQDLRLFMAKRLPPEELNVHETCSEKAKGNSCKNGVCLQLQLPKDPQKRLEQLIRPDNLHPDAKFTKVMYDMGNAIPGFYDIILITGASSNHYLESKKQLYNIHANVLPHLRNVTIIYYNLGLTAKQKQDISSMCRCHVLDFPFEKFPKYFSKLPCMTWKPIIINAHAPHCNVIHWMDASVRYINNPSHLKELFERVRVRGFVGAGSTVRHIPHMTLREMFHFFGDEACAYLPYKEGRGGFNIFLNEPLIKWGILEPWTACALNESCMCLDHVKNPSVALFCGKAQRLHDYVYGRCHRYDQSALGIIVRKLFREKSQHLMLLNYSDIFEIKRGDIYKKNISEDINNKKS